jgi:hypothetical protein
MSKIAWASLLFALASTVARADGAPSTAQLLQDWVCPAGNTCTTQCNGPAGNISFNAHDVKVFQFSVHVRRLWLDGDGQIYVLGDDDHCVFGGATSTPITFVSPPVEVSPLGPPPQQSCFCANNVCNPPGCAPPVSRLQ